MWVTWGAHKPHSAVGYYWCPQFVSDKMRQTLEVYKHHPQIDPKANIVALDPHNVDYWLGYWTGNVRQVGP